MAITGNEITLEDCRGYVSEANLRRGIKYFGLGNIRHVVCRKPNGEWTAVFLMTEWSKRHGGYIGVASSCGFMSV